MNISRPGRATIASLAAMAAILVSLPTTANSAEPPADTELLGYDETTTVGVHNAYEKSTFPFLADALDSGAALIELDVWTNSAAPGWRVSHANPIGNDNNCVGAKSEAELRTGSRDQGLDGCLADMRVWHDANPDHPPVIFKMEMKDGFNAGQTVGSSGSAANGRGPSDFDALVSGQLGDALLRPADLVGDADSTLDEAVRTHGWPTRDAMRGKFLFYLTKGTVEGQNPLDTLHTDVEYGTHVRDLAAENELEQAVAFPAALGARKGDPREAKYEDESIRPWFVVFDGGASGFVSRDIDTEWYRDNGYLLVMTAAESVAPPIDSRTPTEGEARARVAKLAALSASIVTSDWASLPAVLSDVIPRGA
ncbi:phosphatidylinositol-specific phospholipase C domain-containing protein [Rhodococcus marinonascens]|uniref:phosphatidylinositol-specific phospholipase C domain-containing protein n=1 Tax=Rhodococcus marinonascens TaxID=38311 RepID=UPI000A96BEB9|nr:phosphatidylinositol-specific phospholipase C domain-containing protein [Rhodococcus marinonascens]